MAATTTAVVIVGPTLVVTATLPHGGVALGLLSAAVATAGSLAFAIIGAAVWKRLPCSGDVLFSELLLWAWLRRQWAERRLSQQRDLLEQVAKVGTEINVQQLLGLTRLLEVRNRYVHGHSRRVARHAVRVARTMGLSEQQVARIRLAAYVHDVGKLFTPSEILSNPSRLSDAEYAVVKKHAADGAEMLKGIRDREIAAMVRHHHERIDGGGYPDGLVGSQIPIGARVIAVADTFDAITSKRPYRAAKSHKRALDVLKSESGRQLDADAVAAFTASYSSRRSICAVAFVGSALQRAPAALQMASVGSVVSTIGATGALILAPATVNHKHPSGHGHAGNPVSNAAVPSAGVHADRRTFSRKDTAQRSTGSQRGHYIAHNQRPSPRASAVAATPTRGERPPSEPSPGNANSGASPPPPAHQPPTGPGPTEPPGTAPPVTSPPVVPPVKVPPVVSPVKVPPVVSPVTVPPVVSPVTLPPVVPPVTLPSVPTPVGSTPGVSIP
ncbi:MAG TPA: HD-GYP domain-containing protein [Solirubrobacteraceae bacterium]|jgi:putative nucleotidyltransferase with HDIG domain|nr:HD-GYP domain-containing protein [Solirubrobacteraceae bacterium]